MKYLIMVLFVILISCGRTEGNTDGMESNANTQQELIEGALLVEIDLLNENITAQDFNTAGMNYLNMGMWHEAALMFSQAISLEWDNALANYNLARAYSMYISDAIESWDHSDTSGFWFFNNILSEDVMDGVAFGRLYRSMRLDSTLKKEARQEHDFERLRKMDSELFDAITLPEDQRRNFVRNLVFSGIRSPHHGSSFDRDGIFPRRTHFLEFEDADNRRYTFCAADDLLINLNFLTFFTDTGWHYYKINEEMLGKRFEIEFIYQPAPTGFLSGLNFFRIGQAISVREL